MKFRFRTAVVAILTLASGAAPAIEITATNDPNALVNALLAGTSTGIVVTSVELNGQLEDFPEPVGSIYSSGTFTNASGTYGIGPGVVLTTGSVLDAPELSVRGYEDGPNLDPGNGYGYGGFGAAASSAQELLLDPITGDASTSTFYDHFDVTELVINFDMQPGFDQVSFNIVFGSEEYPEFVGSEFVDGFGMFLNGTNIAVVDGLPVNIQHPQIRPLLDGAGDPVPGTVIAGTELDGILAPGGNPVLVFSGLVNPTGNQLRFIVADTSDPIYDTTVYFSALGGIAAVPAPPAAWLLVTAVGALAGRRVLKRRG